MSEAFQLALIQMKVTPDKRVNLSEAGKMISEAAAAGSGLIILPEMFNCPYDNRFFPQYAEDCPGGETFHLLSTMARQEKVYLVGGSLPERAEGGIYNTALVFDPAGKLIAKHRKIHLFDVDLAGGLSFKESDTLRAGNDITVFDTEYGTFGLAVCYDIRFPELMRLMALEGAKLIIVPGAFNMTTGPAHWEALLRIRATDNQVYMAGASPARDAEAGYVVYGHSLVADPWGRVIAKAGTGEEIIYAQIDLERVEQVRRELPLLRHRRTDLYEVLKK